jgi:hypothetical protein
MITSMELELEVGQIIALDDWCTILMNLDLNKDVEVGYGPGAFQPAISYSGNKAFGYVHIYRYNYE